MSRGSAKNGAGAITAKSTSQVLSLENVGRESIYICNPSVNEVWINTGETAFKEKGLYLKKEGGAVFLPGFTGTLSIITTTGEGLVTFLEV